MRLKREWEVIGREVSFAAPPYVTVSKECVRTNSDQLVEDFYRVELAPFSVCVPLLADGGVITLWQYKHGPRAFGLTFPAGYIDDYEAPHAACERELLEETGYEVGELLHLGTFVDNGNQQGCTGSYYLARDCRQVAQPESRDLEIMELRVMMPAEIDAALAGGDFNVVHHVAAWGLARPLIIGG